MSDADKYPFGSGVDFFDDQELDENGVPVKKPGDLPGSEEEEEEAGEYPSPKPSKPIDETDIPKNLYGEKSPELFKEKRESVLVPDESKEFAKQQFPNSPQLAGEPEDPLRNRVIVNHRISETEILNQPGYQTLKEALERCGQCRQLDYSRIEGEDLSGVKAGDLSFKNALLIGVSFKNANIRNSDFSHAELEVDFDGADLRGSSFKGADLSRSTFKDADIRSCDLVSAVLPPPDQMKGAQMAGIKTEEEKPSPQAEIFPT